MTDIPRTWLRGQLLDLKRYSDGSYRAYRLGEDVIDKQEGPYVHLADASAAQQFVSHWYKRP